MISLPSPRTEYYQSSDYFEVQRKVTSYMIEVVDKIGFYPVKFE